MSSELTDRERRLLQYLRGLGSPKVELDIDNASKELSMSVDELAETLVSLFEKGYVKPEKLPSIPPLCRYVERRLLQLEANWVRRFAGGKHIPSGEKADVGALPQPILEMIQSDRWPQDLVKFYVHSGYLDEWRGTITLIDDSKFPSDYPPLPSDPKPLLICITMMVSYLLKLKEYKERVNERVYDMLLNEYNEKIVSMAKLLNRYVAAASFAVEGLSEELERGLRAIEAMKLDEAIRGISRKREIDELMQEIQRLRSELNTLSAFFAPEKVVEALSAKVDELVRMMEEMKISYELMQARYHIEGDVSLKEKLKELESRLESASNKCSQYSAILEVLTGSERAKGSAEILSTLLQTLSELREEGLLRDESWNALTCAVNSMKEMLEKLKKIT